MTDRQTSSKRRIPLRGAVIALGYLIYLLVDQSQPIFTSACIGLGAILFGLAEVDSRTLATAERSRLLEMGTRLLGLGLLALGLFLILR